MQAMTVRDLSRVTTTSACPSFPWVKSGAQTRSAGTGFAAELGTGVVLHATRQSATQASHASLMAEDYRQRNTRRNAVLHAASRPQQNPAIERDRYSSRFFRSALSTASIQASRSNPMIASSQTHAASPE